MTQLSIQKYNPEDAPSGICLLADKKYLHCVLVASNKGLILAYLCLYINPDITYNNQQCLLIGNMHIAEGAAETFMQLLEEVNTEARRLRLNTIIGPINGSTWNEYRLPISSDKPCFLGDLNYPTIYAESLEEFGFNECHKYYTSIADAKFEDIHVQTQQLKSQGVSIRGFNLEYFEAELRKLFPVCLEAFKYNEFFTSIPENGFIEIYKPYMKYIDSRYTLIAEDDIGVVGFVFCYVDDSLIDQSLVIKTIARHPERTYQSLVGTMAKTVINNAITAGIDYIIHAFMHEHNKSFALSNKFDGKVIREYALFIKNLND